MIYLDNASTTPLLFRAHNEFHGNYSSRTHRIGLETRRNVEEARESLGALLGVRSGSIVFTSSATEASAILARAKPWKYYLNTVHKCMIVSRAASTSVGFLSQLQDEMVGVELVNNETGILNAGLLVNPRCVTLDVTQAVGKVEQLQLQQGLQNCKYFFGSCHKFHGPLGVGFLCVNDVDCWDELVDPLISNGQERGVRPGTLNAPAIIHAGKVVQWMLKNGDEYRAKLKHLQSTFENKIKSLTDCWIIGADQERAPHITSLNLPGVENEALIAAVNDRLAIASGSACTSEKVEPSHVLMAMFNDREIADTTVRISYGWFNTEAEVLEAAEIIAKAAETIRSFSL